MQVPVANWDPETAWERFTGFRNLSIEQFCEIQEQLLVEQIRTIGASKLGMRLLRMGKPQSAEEFRETIPITTYADYTKYLDPSSRGDLPAFEYMWAHTTGAQARYKYVPYTRRAYTRMLDNLMGAFLLSTAREPGDVRIGPGSSIMYNVPPRPYLSGFVAFGMERRFGLNGVLAPAAAEHMEFKTKIRTNFEKAMECNVDLIISLTSVLVSAGEQFNDSMSRSKNDKKSRGSRAKLSWRAKLKLGKAVVKAGLRGRKPRAGDVWGAKGIIGWGVDTPVFRDRVEGHWGMAPHEIYACTEGGVMGVQSKNANGMVFNPYMNFVEFLPASEAAKLDANRDYPAQTHLMNEVVPGELYEVIISSYYGMPFVRYRLGHQIRFLPQSGFETLPEFEFLGRADDRLDIAGFTRIDEKTMWQAVRDTGLPIGSWTARIEHREGKPILHLYAEADSAIIQADAEEKLHRALRNEDDFYRDLEDMLGIRPLEITLLPSGTWDRYYDNRLQKGLDLHDLVPPRMNSSEIDVSDLVSLAT
ncbi:MAG: GH3 auxin-responsive promoter family protein [Gammaproteobacteria bacterium]|nr:GH3 auxin-responsive promoter family protein [Gammaproteobacteria bacterium]